jgi:mannitol-1-/sugar-/sorbitol-6-phosphatase
LSNTITTEAAGLLFDNDGVIVSSISSVNRCWRKWAAHYNVPVGPDWEIEHGTRAVDVMQKLVPGINVTEGLKLIEDMELEDVADLTVLPGVKALLESLPMDRWAIVSSATYRLLVGRLKVAGLPVPDKIISGDRVVNGKPHPEPYIKGAELIHAAPKDCIVIEDAPSGVRAGKAAGSRVLGVLGTHSAEDLREAGVDWVVETLEHVKAESTPTGLRLTFEAL